MPHESAIAEQELADAYLELNLAPEAAAIYARVIATFAELGMRAEQARALAQRWARMFAAGPARRGARARWPRRTGCTPKKATPSARRW